MEFQTAVVIDADGYFGDTTRVWFSGTPRESHAYAKGNKSLQVIEGCMSPKGTIIRRGELQTMLAAGFWVR